MPGGMPGMPGGMPGMPGGMPQMNEEQMQQFMESMKKSGGMPNPPTNTPVSQPVVEELD